MKMRENKRNSGVRGRRGSLDGAMDIRAAQNTPINYDSQLIPYLLYFPHQLVKVRSLRG